ncbi:MAG: PDZ domain-containing protein [Woeseiaceae bacterium]
MPRILAAIAASLIAGFALGAWLLRDNPTPEKELPMEAAAGYLDPAVPLAGRMQRLEQIIAEEREARIVLEDQLHLLIDDIERIESERPRASDERDRQADEARRTARRSTQRRSRDFASMLRDMQEQRRNALVESGFSEDEAGRIIQMEAAAQYETMRVAHEAQRAGEEVDRLSFANDPQSVLRRELGDDDYARYLAAQGQPTAVQVTQVLGDSPGSRAGLQPGDEIVSYNGERVFSVNDLRMLTLQGTAGEDVVIEIERDGMRMQLNVQRGPVGITGSSANIRGLNWWRGT